MRTVYRRKGNMIHRKRKTQAHNAIRLDIEDHIHNASVFITFVVCFQSSFRLASARGWMVGGRVRVVVGPDCARHSTGWLGDFDLALPPTSTLTWLQGLCFDFALPLALSLTLGLLLVWR